MSPISPPSCYSALRRPVGYMERNFYGKRRGWKVGRGWRDAWAAHPLCASCVVSNPYRCWFAEALKTNRPLLGICEDHPYRLKRQIPRDICWYSPRDCA